MRQEQLIIIGYIGGAVLSLGLLFSVFFLSLSYNDRSSSENTVDESKGNKDSSLESLGQEEQIGTKEENTVPGQNSDSDVSNPPGQTEEDEDMSNQETSESQSLPETTPHENTKEEVLDPHFEENIVNSTSFSFQKNDVFSSDEHISVLLERSVQDPFQIVVKEKPILCRGEEECLSYVSGITDGYDKGSFTDSRVTLNLDGIDEGVYTVELYQNDQMITVSDEFVITDRRQFLEVSVPFYRETEEGEEEIFTFTDEEMLVRWDSSPDVRKLNIYLEKKDSSKTYTLMENIDNVSSFLWRYVDKEGNPIPQGTYTMIFEDSDTSTILDRVDFAFEKE